MLRIALTPNHIELFMFNNLYKLDNNAVCDKIEIHNNGGIMRKLCTNCYESDFQVTKKGGSVTTELLLFLFFIIPGLMFSALRGLTSKSVCPNCGHPHMVPMDSKRAMEIYKIIGMPEEIEQTVDNDPNYIV